MNERSFYIQTTDNNKLIGTCYEPTGSLKAGVVIAPAMAVEQSFYSDFAKYLAAQGYQVWTFDYCGIGASKPESMRECEASISTWINDDFDVVVKQASADMAGLPLYVIGHSLGGLIAPLIPSVSKVTGIMTIAIGSGAKRYVQPRLQKLMPLLWHVLVPVLCPVFGYFPGSKIGVVGDIPKQAMLQWKRWCLNPEYLLDSQPDGRSDYAAVSCPVVSLFFTDDELLLESGGRFMNDAYTGTAVDFRVIDPADLNAGRIGHFGFFKQRQEKTLWPLVISWLEQQSNTAS